MSQFAGVFIRSEDGTIIANLSDPDADGIGGLDVFVQDQFTNTITHRLQTQEGTFTIASDTTPNTVTFTATGGHGISIGDWVTLLNNTFHMQAEVLNVVTNTITIDRQIDHLFLAAGTTGIRGQTNLNVDGSSTPVEFFCQPPDGVEWDITRIIFTILDGTSMDDGTFGGISALTNGVLIRKFINSTYHNEFLIKSNSDFKLEMYDVEYSDKAPAGQFGFRARRTWAGREKSGVTIRLSGADSDQMQAVINDDLTGLITFYANIQGHIVDD